MALRKQLEQKVREAAQSRTQAEAQMAAAKALIEQGKTIDAPVAEAEAALAEASSAFSSKNYRNALDKAMESGERAKRAMATRVKSVIDSSAHMLELTRRLGADLTGADQATKRAQDLYAQEDLAGAIDHAKRAWKQTEKILHEHLSSRFSSAQSLIVAAKNVGKDVKVAEDFLARARGAVENQDYELALSNTKECLDSIASGLRDETERVLQELGVFLKVGTELGADTGRLGGTLERARYEMDRGEFEKAMDTARTGRAEAEKTVQRTLELREADFQRNATQADEIGGDTKAARDLFRGVERARREGRYGEAMEFLRRAQQDLQNVQFQAVLGTVARSREKFVIAKGMGGDLGRAMERLNEARTLLQSGRYREAIEAARRAEEEIDRVAGAAVELMKTVQGITKGITDGDREGLDTTAAKKFLELAKKSLEGKDIASVQKYVKQAGDELLRAENDRSLAAIESARFLITAGEKSGLPLGEAAQLLEGAATFAKARDHRQAIAQAAQARRLAEAALERFTQDSLGGLNAALKFTGPESGNLKALIEKAEAAIAAKHFETAFEVLTKAQQLAGESSKERALAFSRDMRALVELGDGLGADTRAIAGVLRDVNGSVDQGRFVETLGIRERHIKEVTTFLEDVFNLVKERVVEAKSLNLEIGELRELLKKGRLALDTEDYTEALRVLRECEEKADRAMKGHKEAYAAISTVAALVADAKRKGGEVTQALETLLEAKRAFEGADYAKALDLANRARDQAKHIVQLYAAGQELKTARERLDLLERLGMPAPAMRTALDEAREGMKAQAYDTALGTGQRIEHEATELIREKVAVLVTSSASLLSTLEGSELAAQEERLMKVRELIQRERWEEAVPMALSMGSELEGLKRRSEDRQVALKRAEDLVVEVEAMNIEVPNTRKLLDLAKRAMRAGQPEQAAELAARALKELERERDSSIEKTLRRFEDAILGARKGGVNTKSAEKMLQKAREELQAKRYRQALALAMQSEKETQRASVQQEMASKAIATATKKLTDFKGGAQDVRALLSDAQRAFEEGDYVLALELAIRSGDDLSRRVEIEEETSDVRGSAERVLTAAKAIGADTSRLEARFGEAQSALDSGDVAGGQRTFQEILESGVKACSLRCQTVSHSAAAVVERAEGLGVDTSAARSRLAEGLELAKNEAFEEAFKALTEAATTSREAATQTVEDAWKRADEEIRHKKELGADVTAALARLAESREKLTAGDLEAAVLAAKDSVTKIAKAAGTDQEFIDLTFKVESELKSARKFGIDARDAELKLSEAIRMKGSDLAGARRVAEEAYDLALKAIEAFAPKFEVKVEPADAKLGEWVDATLVLSNVGKALAKDVRARIMGAVEVSGTLEAPTVRAKGAERLPVRLKPTEPGTVPLAIEITSTRLIDGKAYTQELAVTLEVASGDTPAEPEEVRPIVAEVESNCPLCKGKIRLGLAIAKCECGRDYHQPCATRAGNCVACGKPLQKVERKKKISFKLG